jgi:hypothetical protein
LLLLVRGREEAKERRINFRAGRIWRGDVRSFQAVGLGLLHGRGLDEV